MPLLRPCTVKLWHVISEINGAPLKTGPTVAANLDNRSRLAAFFVLFYYTIGNRVNVVAPRLKSFTVNYRLMLLGCYYRWQCKVFMSSAPLNGCLGRMFDRAPLPSGSLGQYFRHSLFVLCKLFFYSYLFYLQNQHHSTLWDFYLIIFKVLHCSVCCRQKVLFCFHYGCGFSLAKTFIRGWK